MSDKWIEAASRFASTNTEVGLKPEQVLAVSQIAFEMMQFSRSPEGAQAALLLELAEGAVFFGRMDGPVGPFGESAILCWTHLGPSMFAQGSSVIPRRRPIPTSFLNLAKVAVKNGLIPEEFPGWFRDQIDQIAAKAYPIRLSDEA